MIMKALITGITGQDGYYLTKFLLEKNYEVHGIIRRSSTFNTIRIDQLISEYAQEGRLNLHYSDLLDPSSLSNLVETIRPQEIYNLGAQSHVAVSFKNPLFTAQTSVIGPITLLESIRNVDTKIRYYQASSSEMFGGTTGEFLNEKSLFEPKSPYAVGKVFAHEITKVYRESYGIHAVNGILFNHESPHRGETFVTRKITRAVGRIKQGIQKKLTLGNLDASRDWGFAGDYVHGMYLMMQHDLADDWILATGETHTVKEFAVKAFSRVGLDWEDYIEINAQYQRPNEVHHLLGDPSKAKKELSWKTETSFDDLINMMVDSDLELAKREKILLDQDMLKPSWENPIK
jgi:GDPmannose 4,6-dehydratase